jgi:hypothetical protein
MARGGNVDGRLLSAWDNLAPNATPTQVPVMALITCPECGSQVSDRAAACPKCGYPLEDRRTFASALTGHRWEARSAGLAAEALEASFNNDGSFEGALKNPPNDLVIKPQRVTGRWHVAGSLLLLSYRYVMEMAGPGTAEFTIEISEATEDRLAGVDKLLRMWEFERLQ